MHSRLLPVQGATSPQEAFALYLSDRLGIQQSVGKMTLGNPLIGCDFATNSRNDPSIARHQLIFLSSPKFLLVSNPSIHYGRLLGSGMGVLFSEYTYSRTLSLQHDSRAIRSSVQSASNPNAAR